MANKHNEVRRRWLRPADLTKMEEQLKSYGFMTGWYKYPYTDGPLSHGKPDELKVKADTIAARLSGYTAVIYQRDPATPTEKDLQLKNVLADEYPHKWGFLAPD